MDCLVGGRLKEGRWWNVSLKEDKRRVDYLELKEDYRKADGWNVLRRDG